MSSGPELRFEHLLEHHGFVRALARELVRDEARADDVAQEALLAAARHQLRNPGSIRSWLRRVVRSLVSDQREQEMRRARREKIAAPAEATVDTAGIVERL